MVLLHGGNGESDRVRANVNRSEGWHGEVDLPVAEVRAGDLPQDYMARFSQARLKQAPA